MSIQTDASNAANLGLLRNPLGQINFDDEYFKNDSKKNGCAIILNQNKFDKNIDKEKLGSRDGSDVDVKNLVKVFGSFNIEIIDVCTDCTTHEIETALNKARRKNYTQYNFLIVVFMSHGNENKVYTQDGQIEVKTIWSYFTGDRCSSLKGKPKLFFIQACRGVTPDMGCMLSLEEEDDKRMSKVHQEKEEKIPITADILVMFSSADGYVSLREKENGSWFIQGICKAFENFLGNRKDKDLMHFLTDVNRFVAYNKEAYDPNGDCHGYKQMPVIMSMLTKILMLNAKYISEKICELAD